MFRRFCNTSANVINTSADRSTLKLASWEGGGGLYIPNLKRSSVVFTRSRRQSFNQSYVVARSSYAGCSQSYDQSWQIADSHRLSYDGRTMIVQQSATYIQFRLQHATIIEDPS